MNATTSIRTREDLAWASVEALLRTTQENETGARRRLQERTIARLESLILSIDASHAELQQALHDILVSMGDRT